MNEHTLTRGFTMVEFIMVLAISAVLILGLSTIIEVPRMMIEERETGQSVSAIDRMLSRLDRDIRFASDVAVPDPNTLRVTLQDGQEVTYTWSGSPGDPIVRNGPDGAAQLARQIQGCAFALETAAKQQLGGTASVNQTAVDASAFDSFQLKPGYVLTSATRTARGVLGAVTVQRNPFWVSAQRRLGLFVKAGNLSDDDGVPSSLRLRLRRNGTSDLEVRVYEAHGDGDDEDGDGDDEDDGPDKSKLIAIGYMPNAALPATYAHVAIPLATVKKLKGNKNYFVEIAASGGDFAAEVEVETLSDPDACENVGGVMTSTDTGVTYSTSGSAIRAAQVPYSLQAVKSHVDTSTVVSATATEEVPVAVRLKLQILTKDGSQDLDASFPILNKLLELH